MHAVRTSPAPFFLGTGCHKCRAQTQSVCISGQPAAALVAKRKLGADCPSGPCIKATRRPRCSPPIKKGGEPAAVGDRGAFVGKPERDNCLLHGSWNEFVKITMEFAGKHKALRYAISGLAGCICCGPPTQELAKSCDARCNKSLAKCCFALCPKHIRFVPGACRYDPKGKAETVRNIGTECPHRSEPTELIV